MSHSYLYPLSDFPGPVDSTRLEREIMTNAAIIADPASYLSLGLVSDGVPPHPDVVVVFDAPLAAPAKAELDQIVATLDPTPLEPDCWTVAQLGVVDGDDHGEQRFAADGRTASQGAGNGSGVWVYWSTGQWLTVYGNDPVQA